MWRIKPPARMHLFKRRQTKSAKEILEKLRNYLDNENAEPIKILCGFWKDQQDAITYQELRVLVEQGYLDEVTARLWQQDYSVLVKDRMPKIWGDAMIAGSVSQPVMEKALSAFTFNTQTPGVVEWMRSRGAALVTSSTQTQKDAISLLLEDKIREKYTVDELARLIRPTIGLYRQQTSAVEKYYSNMVESLTKDHPRTKPDVIRQRALTQSTKYAERLHRQRAMTIAQTEMAYAYNYGADEGIRQAQADFLIGTVDKKWCTSGDENVCEECEKLDGEIIGMDEVFFSGNKTEYDISGLYPPLHPRCACAVEYIETEAPYHVWQSGGHIETGEALYEWQERRDNEAEEYYETIRGREDDIEKISTAVGWKAEDVAAVKNHVFFDTHELYEGAGRFQADYNMAVAWQRLINGEPEETDILLLKHELLESQAEKNYTLSASQAHAIAKKQYPWDETILDKFGEDGEEDGSLHDFIQRERK